MMHVTTKTHTHPQPIETIPVSQTLVMMRSGVQSSLAAPATIHTIHCFCSIFRNATKSAACFILQYLAERRRNMHLFVTTNGSNMTQKILAMFRAAALAAGLLTGAHASAASISAIDGDTIIANGVHYRLVNIDTPETGKRARCDSEQLLGEMATRRMRALLGAGIVTIKPVGRIDRYNRPLAFVALDGRDIGEIMVAEGLAVKWQGRRHAWCTSP
jgi:endonuclease YncB( thermonuclease family)